jgi:hypothetical protein
MVLNEEHRSSNWGVFFTHFQKAMEATREVGALYFVCAVTIPTWSTCDRVVVDAAAEWVEWKRNSHTKLLY